MNYWNPQIGYLRTGQQFRINGITYPKNWLKYASDNDLTSINIIKEPSYDSATQVLEKDSEVGWVVREKTVVEVEADEISLEAAQESNKKNLIDQLWKAATDYEQQFISGSAPAKIGLLTLGGNLKAVAISEWVEAIWADYYSRRSSVESGLLEVSTDFSNNGTIPYTIWETIYGDGV